MSFIPKQAFPTTVKVISKEVSPYFGVTSIALAKMKCYIDGCTDEIGWFFTASQDVQNSRIYYIKDCYLFPQQVHATTTEIDNDKLTDFATKLLMEENGMDIWNELRGWGHSHVNMGVSPSGQDDNQMEFFSRAGQPFFVRIIANKKGELKIDLYNYETGVAFIDVPWIEVPVEGDREIVQQIQALQARLDKSREEREKFLKEGIEKEIKEKVSKFVQFSSEYTRPASTYGKDSNFQRVTTWTSKEAGISNKTLVTYVNAKLETEADVFKDFDLQELKDIGYQPTIHAMRTMIFEITGKLYNQDELKLITKVAMEIVEDEFIRASNRKIKPKQNKSKVR